MSSRVILQPRGYQIEAANEAIAKNTIINIQTGGGKTLIAVIVINKYLGTSDKVICFLVPSRALVSQQAGYLRNNCEVKNGRPLIIAELSGQELEHWGQSKWTETLKQNDILVGTPEVFRRAFIEKAFISPTRFSLIVFDECHNAVGNSPMASIMRNAVMNFLESDRPRILGLTASFVSGSTSSSEKILKKRQELETLFQANICSPTIPIIPGDEITVNKFTFVTYPSSDIEQYKILVEDTVRNVLRVIPSVYFEEREKWVAKGWKLYEALGAEALRYWLKEGIIVQLMGKADEMEKNPDIVCQKLAKRIRDGLESTTKALQTTELLPLKDLPAKSEQLMELFRLLKAKKSEANTQKPTGKSDTSDKTDNSDNSGKSNKSDGTDNTINAGKAGQTELITFKGIIFVEQTAFTHPLSYMINKHFQEIEDLKLKKCPNCHKGYKPDLPVSLPVNGVGSMKDSQRNANMDAFRSGEIPILISTAALEEGIDVPGCSFVIRYDAFSTTKSHVQGSGRARCKNARIYYFKNDPNVECGKASLLDSIAKDKSLNLSFQSLKIGYATSMERTVLTTLEYPYYPKGVNGRNGGVVGEVGGTGKGANNGEVNFFNCLPIFFEYVQKVMRQSYDPAVLFDVEEEVIRSIPLETRKVIVSVIYPSPTGVQMVEREEIDAYWGATEVQDVVRPVELLKKVKSFDLLKRRAVYFVVIRLHETGLLSQCNEATSEAIHKCQSTCPAFSMENKIKLSDSFGKKGGK